MPIVAAVNSAIVRAATDFKRVRVLRMDLLFTPMGYRESMRYRGRDVRVREGDGIHLNVAGTAIAARAVAQALRETKGACAAAVSPEGGERKLRAQGVTVRPLRNGKGQTVSEQAALQAAGGFDVWRSYDEPGGIRDELYDLAAANRNLVKLEVLGHTHQGREIIALRVTDNWRQLDSSRRSRPTVLYSSAARARVGQRRGQPPHAAPLRRRPPRRERIGARAAAQHRAVVRRGGEP